MATSEQKPSTDINISDVVKVSQIPELYPHLYSENAWSWAVRNKKSNGLDQCIHSVGRKQFINLKAFAKFLSGAG